MTQSNEELQRSVIRAGVIDLLRYHKVQSLRQLADMITERIVNDLAELEDDPLFDEPWEPTFETITEAQAENVAALTRLKVIEGNSVTDYDDE